MADAPLRSITVVGFGLIGASLAAALKTRDTTVHVIAADLPATLTPEAVGKLADECVDATEPTALAAAMSATELTVLAAPVRIIEQQLPAALRAASLVTDCGSTKRTIVDVARACGRSQHFVPGHPMAGRTMGGAAAAAHDLFEKKRWLLCSEQSSPEAVQRVQQVVEYVGATVVEMGAEAHDRAVAVTSHAPQIFASLLAVYARRANAEVAAGPAYVSATRVAGGNLAMWRDIFSTNAEAVSEVILELAAELQRVGESLRHKDVEEVVQLLKKARELRAGRSYDDS